MASSDSEKLQQYVQQITSVPNLHQYSPESKQLIKTIYDHAITASRTPVAYQVLEERFSSESAKGAIYDGADHAVRTHIESLNKYSINVSLSVGGRTYRLFFVFPMSRDTITNAIRAKCGAEVEAFVKRAHIWLSIAFHYASTKCSKTVNAYLYMTALKKTLPSKSDDVIDREHANTAFTTSCQETTEIMLYRREEAFKVFIHESFHNLGLDFSAFETATSVAKAALQQIFPVSSKLAVYETYCEMWAEVINIVIQDVVEHPRRRGFETAWPTIVRHINMERRFTMFQAAKVLTHNGVRYADLMIPGNRYQEKAEVFCYYILKSILMFHCDAFLAWCSKNNALSGLQFDPANAEKYVRDLIVGYYNNVGYVEALNKTQEHFVKNRARFPALIRNTMRMTVIE
jgi:hypothetical protein